MTILEFVPNVTLCGDAEARVHALERVSPMIVDVHADGDHDRAVVTLVARAGARFDEAMCAVAAAALDGADLGAACGVHPCFGAVDVAPVVALASTDGGPPGPDDHAAAAGAVERFAAWLAREHGVRVVRYGIDATGEDIAGAGSTGVVRHALRGGEARVATWFGPPVGHRRLGTTIAGVRRELVACNVELRGARADRALTSAAVVARDIRAATRGPRSIPGVRALAFERRSAGAGCVQVSANLEQPATSGPAVLLEAVAAHPLVGSGELTVTGVEVVGCARAVALRALADAASRLDIPNSVSPRADLDAAIAQALEAPRVT